MNQKLTGLENFDKFHLIAIICSIGFIVLVPIIGSKLNSKNQQKFIVYLIFIAVFQEIIDYIARINFDGLNLAEDLPLHICSYALFMSCYALYKKDQFCFEFSYLLGVTGTFVAILTPELDDFDGWTMYVTYFIHHSVIPTFSIWNIFIDGMRPRKFSVFYCLVFLAILAIPVGIVCWLTGGNYMYLARIPAVDNPIVFGEWPYYIIYLGLIGIIFMLIAKLPFDVKNFLDRRKS